MTDTLDSFKPETSGERARPDFSWLAMAIILILAAGVLGYWLGNRQTGSPAENSADVGFTRDMIQHHAQAVDMATLIRDRSSDERIRQLALDIMLTQQAQIGQMQGWLTAWGIPIAHTGAAMAWMGEPVTGLMPGMASAEQINELRSMTGGDAEAMFLELMIIHHRAGVVMAEAALEKAGQAEVRGLAQSIVTAQTSEIELMQSMLAERGLPPIPEAAEMDH